MRNNQDHKSVLHLRRDKLREGLQPLQWNLALHGVLNCGTNCQIYCGSYFSEAENEIPMTVGVKWRDSGGLALF